MAIEKQQPLRGIRRKDLYKEKLRGWEDLSIEERDSFLDKNPDLKDKSFKFVSNAYDNGKYIKEFGLDAFKANTDKASRDLELRQKYKENAINDLFGDGFEEEDAYTNISTKDKISGMTLDAFEELLNSDYVFPADMKERRAFEEKMSRFKEADYATYTVSKTLKNVNEDIIDQISDKYQKIDLANASQMSDRILSQLNQMDNGEVSKMTHDVVENLGLYKAYKDHHEMKDFGPEHQKKMLADYLAVLEITKNPARAEAAITNYLQDYIHYNQTAWDWWGSALSGIGTKAAADFGNMIVGINALAGRAMWGKEWLNLYLQGLDENGNQRFVINNAKYWNGVDQYNTFDYDTIYEIEENGGISPFNWLSAAGNERNLSAALNEGVKMMGYTAAQAVIGYAVGGAAKLGAKATGGIFSTAGELLEGSSKAARTIMQASPVVSSALNAIPISAAYAKGSYDQTYQEATQRLEVMKEHELNSMFDGVKMTEHGFDGSEGHEQSTNIAAELNANVANLFQQLVDAGAKPEDIDIEEVAAKVLNDYREQKKGVLDEQYKDLEHEARMEATSAYERNATIEFLRMSGVNYLFKDYLMDKSSRLAKRANRTPLKAVDNGGKLEMRATFMGKTVDPKYARYYDIAKSVWGGFESNFMDDVTAAYSQGFSLGRYNNKLAQAFNPEKAVATSSWIAGVTSAVASAEKMLVDPQAWYDGAIGALGPAESLIPTRGIARLLSKTGRTINNYNVAEIEQYAKQLGLTKEQFVRGEGYEDFIRKANPDASDAEIAEAAKKLKDDFGFDKLVEDGILQKLSVAERINNYVMNPLLQNYSDARERERQFQNRIDAGNEAIAEKKDAINDLINVANSLNSYEQTLAEGKFVDLKEAKTYKAFTLSAMIDSWSKDPILSQSQFVKDAQAKLDRLSKGQITEADVNEFLSYNKSVKESTDAVDIAKQRLQENAKQIVEMQKAYSEMLEKVQSMPDYSVVANISKEGAAWVAQQLAFNSIMSKNRIDRVNQMSEEIGVTTNMDMEEGNVAALGTKASRQNYYMQAVEDAQKASEEARKAEDAYDKAKELKKDPLKKLKVESARLAMEEAHRKETAAKKLAKNREVQAAMEEVELLSADEILNLNATDRARMLNEKNRNDYSQEQKAEIEKAIQKLRLKDPDALQKIQDIASLTEANQDLVAANEIFLNNMEAAANYFNYMRDQRAKQFENVVKKNEWMRRDIEVENAATDTDKINLLKTGGIDYIEHYFNTHDGTRETLDSALKISKLITDINSAITKARQETINGIYQRDDLNAAEKKEAVRRTRLAYNSIGKAAANSILLDSNVLTEQDAMRVLEETLDAQPDSDTKVYYNRVMDEVAKIGHQRDATVLQTREQKRKAEEWKKQQLAQKDGNNFGFDGYKVGDTIYHKDGRSGVVKKFFNSNGEGKMEVSWNGTKGTIIYGKSELPNFSKTKFEEQTKAPEVIETPRPQSEKSDAELISQGESVPEFTEEGKIVQKSEEQQAEAARAQSEGESLSVSETPSQEVANPEVNTENGLMIGNGIYRYDMKSLEDLGEMKLRAGRQQGDTMNSFFDWLSENHIQLQEIIDTELGKIWKANPDMKVQFMYVNKPGMTNHVVLVVEVTPEIERLHNKDLGGIVEAGGKRYLTIGTYAWNRADANGATKFKSVAEPLRSAARASLANGEEYFVHPTMHTKIAKIDAGRLVKQQVNEESASFRTLGELFADRARNPEGITFENAVFGIMYQDKFFQTNGKEGTKKIFPPGKSEATLGKVFLMIPAANGNYIPVALKSNVTINELRDGEFKDAIYDVLRRIVSPDLATRKEAIAELNSYIVLGNNTNILVGNDKHNNVSIVRNGTVVFSRGINATFNHAEFEKAVFDTPFKVNIIQRAIESPLFLKWLDEAGALQTDVSLLRTVNAAYQVFETKADGTPNEFAINQPVPDERKLGISKAGMATSVGGKTYRLINNEYYDELGNVVSDPAMRTNIRYNILIQRSKLEPAITSEKSGAKIYILNSSPVTPVVVRVNADGTVKVASEEEAAKTVIQVRERNEAIQRAKEAQAALDASLEQGSFEEIPSWDDNGIPVQTQPQVQESTQTQASIEEKSETPVKEEKPMNDPNKATRKSLAQLEAEKKSTKFGSLYSQRRKELNEIAKEKGWNWGRTPAEISKFLEKKLGDTFNPEDVGDFDTFIDNLKNCYN